jgi:hypothetical protein
MIEEIHGTSGSKDERGLISLVVPFLASTFEEVLAAVKAPGQGLAESARTWSHDRGGKFVVEVTFEGQAGSSNPEAETTYECKSSFREEPIEAHPQIAELVKKFNGQTDTSTGRVTFPATLEGSAGTSGLGGAIDGATPETKNPMAGVEKYMALEIVWSKKYISRNKPSFARVGRVISAPPGEPPAIPKRDAWLVLPPVFVKRGSVYEITEEWQLLPEGTPKEVYNLGSGDVSTGAGLSEASPADLGGGPAGIW